ncbi:Beta-glucuronosyltransferase GlcAT14A [Linum grandiflorum]
MYFANTAYPLETYFHTVLCNSPDFHNTTILNSDLRYNINDHKKGTDRPEEWQLADMLGSGAVFARAFRRDDHHHLILLDKVDQAALKLHRRDEVDDDEADANKVNIDVVKAGLNGVELGILLAKLVSQGTNTSTNTGSYCHQMLSNQ